jgi:hypothetical protein
MKCRYSTTRRDMLKLGSLVIGLGSSYFALTHMKAMSYASPKALLNALLGVGQPSLASGSGTVLLLIFYSYADLITMID